MAQKFIENGYEIIDFENEADVYVVNTCTVTNMSDRKSRQVIRRAKQKNKKAILVVCGCYVQVAKEQIEKMPEVDIVLGINEKNDVVKYVEEFNFSKQSMVSSVKNQKEFLDFGQITYTEKTRAVIKIQDGCDMFCSYCIIPYARGRVRSRKIESIVNETKKIVELGIKEIVITGIHIASYGKDFKENIGLIDLLENLNTVEGLKRIRLGSIEPTLITDEFLARLTKLEKVCKHFHLSLQSGCNYTLKRMNRKYTTEEFEKVALRLREAYPDVVLTTDIIVGFPGETDEEFAKTYEFLKKINFYKMHVFQYSPREGTIASKMENQIDSKVKEQRSKKLIELSEKMEIARLEKEVGKVKEVLFEQKEGEYQKGHTENYIEILVKTNEQIENKICNVKATNIDKTRLIGNIEI